MSLYDLTLYVQLDVVCNLYIFKLTSKYETTSEDSNFKIILLIIINIAYQSELSFHEILVSS